MNDATGRDIPAPPTARKIDCIDTHHGRERNDVYAWMRADNWQEVMRDASTLESGIREHLEAENAYTKAALADTEDLQAALFEEMKGRIKEDDSSVPSPDGPFAYYVSYITGGQHPRFCRQPRDGGEEQILIDGNAMAEGEKYFKLAAVEHSPDHKLAAYSTDQRGAEYFTISLRDLDTGEDLADVIEETTGGVTWAADSRTFFYVRVDENHRPSKVFRHTIGSDPADDELVYEEADPGFFVGAGKTQSGDYIVIHAHDHQTAESRLIDARDPASPPLLIAAREVGHEYEVEHQGDRLLILTNCDDAEDFKIMEAPVDAPGRENWRDVLAHKPGRLVLTIAAFQDHVVRLEREDSMPRIVISDIRNDEEHAIAFDEEAYQLGLSTGYEFETTGIRFSYSSMTTPSQVFDYDMASRDRKLRKTQEVPSGHNPDDYVTRRIMAPATDGEAVPVSLLYRKDTPLDGSAPLLLYGYGSYGIAIPAAFSTTCLSLVDRGFVYAVAHIRGGKDKGYGWYKQGRRENKRNTFTDFIAAGEYLVAENFATRGRIIAHGGSAGGMLVGAVANMAPDLFAAIIADVPFVDVLTTMLDDTLPLTPPEWPEWGNPIEDQEAYDYIASYSPYDNVTAQAYPSILAIAGLADPRVTYWEPAKWVAKLRELKTDDNPVMLKTDMETGHGGSAGRFDRLKEVALNYAFALKTVGLADRQPSAVAVPPTAGV